MKEIKKEIKFRAWDSKRNEMLYHGQFRFKYNYDGGISLHRKIDCEVPIKNGKYNLMEYIGMKDKNGIEIYDGDIINSDSVGKGLKVYYDLTTASFRYGLGWTFQYLNHIEVVGNIYKNPELLEKSYNIKYGK